MQRTIIMDTSFFTWLDQFDQFCRARGRFLGLAPYQMPIEALDHLMAMGCHLVIPNEVLKELTHGRNGRIGISINAEGEAYLDHGLIAQNSTQHHNRNITDWLTEKLRDHKVDCYTNADDFWQHAQSDAAQGRISIAAYDTPIDGGGFESHERRDQNMIGDYEIENLLACCPLRTQPKLLLSTDYELNANARAAAPHVRDVSGSTFMEMVALTGFIHDFTIFPKALAQFRRVAKNLPVDHPSSITHRIMRDVITEWGLNRFMTAEGERPSGFATTLQERQRLARNNAAVRA